MSEPTTGYSYRYTDRDVREDPRLYSLAQAYLQTYGGEFEPLLRAKQYLALYGHLTTVLARTTLNCMRNDAHVAAQLPEPQRQPLRLVEEDEVDRVFRRRHPEVDLHEEEKPRRRYPFELKTKWKLPIVAAAHPRATVFHYLDPVRSHIKYYPEVKYGNKFQVRVETYCGQSPATGVVLAEAPKDRKECKACRETKVSLAERYANQAAVRAQLEGGSDAE